MTTKIALVADPYTGETRRMNLSGAIDLDMSQVDWGQGIDLLGVYLMPRSKRVVVHTYSRWEDRRHPGRVRGESYHEADNDQIARLAKEFREERLANLLPEFVDA